MTEEGSISVRRDTRWLIGLGASALLLFGGFLGRAFELGATYATQQDVAEEVGQLRREIGLSNETTKANFETVRAEMRGIKDALQGQIEALRAEVLRGK